jgi:hypothetical protein
VEVIERRIYLIRGQKVMLDSALVWLYQVETFNLNKTDLQTQGRFSLLIGWRLLQTSAWPIPTSG